MTATYDMLQTRRIDAVAHTHTHCTRSDRRLRLITLKRVNEREGRENTSIVAGMSLFRCAFTHLLSRQQIHSADGDELGDVCTATIFPGRVTVKAVM